MPIKAVFFDNDGVLVSTEHLVYEANLEVFTGMGIPYRIEDFVDHTLLTDKGSRGFVYERGFDDGFYADFVLRRNAVWFDVLGESDHSIEGVREVLDAFSGLDLVITTSAQEEPFKRSHLKTGLLEHFSSWITREQYAREKPHPDVYLQALEQSRLRANEIIAVEDTPRGVQAVRSAGLTAVAIPHGFTVGMDFSEADYVLNSIRELPDLIAEINSR